MGEEAPRVMSAGKGAIHPLHIPLPGWVPEPRLGGDHDTTLEKTVCVSTFPKLDLLGKHLVTQGESDHKDLFILHLIV